MKKGKRAIRARYVRPAFGREEAAETRRRRRAVCALAAIEVFLLALAVLLAADMAGV